MDRAVRIIPVAVALVFALWAYLVFDRTLSETVSTPTTPESIEAAAADASWDDPSTDDRSPDGTATNHAEAPADAGASVDRFGAPPAELAFLPSFGSRIYQVSGEIDGIDEVVAREAEWDEPLGGHLFPLAGEVARPPLGSGLYATSFDAIGCSYELRRDVNRGDNDRVIGQDQLTEGRMLVSINEIEPDLFVPGPECGPWTAWSALSEPLVSAAPGDYWIGDLVPGRWEVPEGCLWEEVVDFRGARLADVIGSGRGPGELLIDDETLGIRFRGCDRPLVLVEAISDPRPPGLRRSGGS